MFQAIWLGLAAMVAALTIGAGPALADNITIHDYGTQLGVTTDGSKTIQILSGGGPGETYMHFTVDSLVNAGANDTAKKGFLAADGVTLVDLLFLTLTAGSPILDVQFWSAPPFPNLTANHNFANEIITGTPQLSINYRDNGGAGAIIDSYYVQVTSAPEPGSVVLLSSVLLAMGALRRVKGKASITGGW